MPGGGERGRAGRAGGARPPSSHWARDPDVPGAQPPSPRLPGALRSRDRTYRELTARGSGRCARRAPRGSSGCRRPRALWARLALRLEGGQGARTVSPTYDRPQPESPPLQLGLRERRPESP